MKNIISVEGLADWLERQNKERMYKWASDNCLIIRYLKAIGLNKRDACFAYGEKFSLASRLAIVYPEPRTYGAALARAREYLREEGEKAE